jgi:xylulose-5-phosphate/fructose-6-phosphate phosphoketolase
MGNEMDYDSLFTKDKHIIFIYHGYLWLVHLLTYKRKNRNLPVQDYKKGGTITTPFNLRVKNEVDRFHLVIDAADRLPGLASRGSFFKQQ